MKSQSENYQALLIIDMQNGLFHGSQLPFNKGQVLENINTLIAKARASNTPIIAVRHVGPTGSPISPESPLSQLIPELHIDLTTDIILEKTRPSCFYKTELSNILARLNIQTLIIAGMKTDFCIDTTCRIACEYDLKAILVADAHTTFDNDTLNAKNIIDHHNLTMNNAFAKVIDTKEVSFSISN